MLFGVFLVVAFSCCARTHYMEEVNMYRTEFFGTCKSSDGGFLAVGTEDKYLTYDDGAYVFKFDEDGEISWFIQIGNDVNDQFHTCFEDSDGNYVVAGEMEDSNDNGILAIAKLSSSGNVMWLKKVFYDRTPSSIGQLESAFELPDGNYMFGGTSYIYGNGYAIILAKTNPQGDLLNVTEWKDPSYALSMTSFEMLPSGDFIGLGTRSTEALVPILYYFDSSMQLQWAKDFHFDNIYADDRNCYGLDLTVTNDGGIIFTGGEMMSQLDYPEGYFIVKMNDTFSGAEWSKTIFPFNGWSISNDVYAIERNDGSFFIVGRADQSFVGVFSADGEVERMGMSTKVFGPSTKPLLTDDDGLIVADYVLTNALVFKTTNDFAVCADEWDVDDKYKRMVNTTKSVEMFDVSLVQETGSLYSMITKTTTQTPQAYSAGLTYLCNPPSPSSSSSKMNHVFPIPMILVVFVLMIQFFV